MWQYTHTHTHTHTSVLENIKKNSKFFAEKLAKVWKQTEILKSTGEENIKTLINIKVEIRNRIEKKSRNIISCDYIDTG